MLIPKIQLAYRKQEIVMDNKWLSWTRTIFFKTAQYTRFVILHKQ
jgi:hypothetical protein